MPAWFRFIVMLPFALLAGNMAMVAAAALPGAGSPLRSGEVYPSMSHAWAVIPASGGRGYVMVHLPPRVSGDARPGALAGSIRSGYRLEEAPESMAAYGDRVYLFFRPKPRGDNEHTTQRAVFAQSVRRLAQSDLWVDEPAGRLETLPVLADAGDLIASAADERGPIVLVERAGMVTLLALDGDQWKKVKVSPDVERVLRAGSGSVALAVEGSAVHLAALHGGEFFTASTSSKTLRDPGAVWTWSSAPVQGLATPAVGQRFVLAMGRWLVVDTPNASAMTIRSIGDGSLTDLCTIAIPHPTHTIAWQLGAGRCIIISTSAAEGRDPAAALAHEAPTRVIEVSLITGNILYDDRIQPASPLGTREFRFLAIVLVLAMATVLVLVLRGQPDAVHLPEGFALAEPMRRIIAGVLDIALASLIVPRIVGHGLFDLFDPNVWISGDAIRVLVALAAVGATIGSLGEWLFGRSPGKLVTDCEVVSVAGAPGAAAGEASGEAFVPRASLPACVVRNAVKWFLSPVALLALLDDTGRHRGDQLARSAVVVEIRDEDELSDVE